MTDSLTTINAIADIYDGPHATPEKIKDGPYFLSISSLQNGRLVLSESARLSDADFVRWTKRVTPKEGDLLFSYETRLGEAALMPAGVNACLGRRMGLLRPKNEKVLPEYLLYAYLAPHFQKEIVANTIKGATVERISVSEIGNFKIRIPSMTEQQRIVDTLSILDAKIDLNNRINAELEALAKTIYDYWFVQFDFPDANGRPYKSSGGAMVWNDTLKREIPAAWEVVPLGNLVDTVKDGAAPNNSDTTTPYVGLEHIARKSIALSAWSTADQATSQKIAFRRGDILFGKIRPYFHKVAFASFDGIASTDAIIMRPKKSEVAGLVLETVFSDPFVTAATASSTGSKMPRADWNVMKRYGVALPNQGSDTLSKYQDLFRPIVSKIDSHVQQNVELTQLRDWLLPLLMNGQVRVA
jgi:type I restriction enzyme S subunit